MNYKLSPLAYHQERSSTDSSSLVRKTVVVTNKAIKHYLRRTQHKTGRAFCSDLYTIAEGRGEETEDPVVRKTHRRTGATDWTKVISRIYQVDTLNGDQIQPKHRRSMAWI